MSCDTDGESFPSKYQQIKWIVSLQLISPVPSEDELKFEFFPGSVHFPGQNVMENTDYNCLKMKEKRKSSEPWRVFTPTTLPVPTPERISAVAGHNYPGLVMVISRSAAIRCSSGGCVLNSELHIDPRPNIGFTMHNADVVCGILLGIR